MSDTDVKSPSRGERTRTQIMDIAEAAILEKGYAATSIDELIAQAGITKSGFFYHFEDKAELGKALVKRDNEGVERALTQVFAEANTTYPDPLDALLHAMERYGELAAMSTAARPGCLAAAFTYQDALFDDEMRALVRFGFTFKRAVIRAQIEKVAAQQPARSSVDFDGLADMAIAIVQGAFVMDRVRETPVLHAQVGLYRTYLSTIFAPTPH